MNSSDISFKLSIINHLGFKLGIINHQGHTHVRDWSVGFSNLGSLQKSQKLMKVGRHKAERCLGRDVCVLVVVFVCKCVLKDEVGLSSVGSHISGELD